MGKGGTLVLFFQMLNILFPPKTFLFSFLAKQRVSCHTQILLYNIFLTCGNVLFIRLQCRSFNGERGGDIGTFFSNAKYFISPQNFFFSFLATQRVLCHTQILLYNIFFHFVFFNRYPYASPHQ